MYTESKRQARDNDYYWYVVHWVSASQWQPRECASVNEIEWRSAEQRFERTKRMFGISRRERERVQYEIDKERKRMLCQVNIFFEEIDESQSERKRERIRSKCCTKDSTMYSCCMRLSTVIVFFSLELLCTETQRHRFIYISFFFSSLSSVPCYQFKEPIFFSQRIKHAIQSSNSTIQSNRPYEFQCGFCVYFSYFFFFFFTSPLLYHAQHRLDRLPDLYAFITTPLILFSIQSLAGCLWMKNQKCMVHAYFFFLLFNNYRAFRVTWSLCAHCKFCFSSSNSHLAIRYGFADTIEYPLCTYISFDHTKKKSIRVPFIR